MMDKATRKQLRRDRYGDSRLGDTLIQLAATLVIFVGVVVGALVVTFVIMLMLYMIHYLGAYLSWWAV